MPEPGYVKDKNGVFVPVDKLDPDKFYLYKARARSAQSDGLERWVYQKLGPELISSVALAIDPLSNYKTASGRITPTNRNREHTISSVFDEARVMRSQYVNVNGQTPPNYGGQIGVFAPFLVYTTFTGPDGAWTPGSGPKAPLFSRSTRDTTKRTRPFDSSQGEFDTFRYQVNSSQRNLVFTSYRYTGVQTFVPNPSITTDFVTYYKVVGPSASVYPKSHADQLRSKCESLAEDLLKKHGFSMLEQANPFARRFTFFRNLVELRDLPRSISQLQTTAANLKQLVTTAPRSIPEIVFNLKASIKDVPKEYLSYHFGWKQLYKAVNDLLDYPAKVSRELNREIKRSGQRRRSRVSRDKDISGTFEGLPGLTYTLTDSDGNVSETTRVVWKAELRLVVDSTISLPEIDVPKFKRGLYLDKLGIIPRPSDIYNLTPWTWLIDWFTGTGTLMSHYENMYTDRRLINWGLITVKVSGTVTTVFRSEHYESSYLYKDGVFSGGSSLVPHLHTSTVDFKYQVRRNVSSILDGVRSISVPATLTDYQRSILLALLSQSGFKRR
jgi:hypothetical protein